MWKEFGAVTRGCAALIIAPQRRRVIPWFWKVYCVCNGTVFTFALCAVTQRTATATGILWALKLIEP